MLLLGMAGKRAGGTWDPSGWAPPSPGKTRGRMPGPDGALREPLPTSVLLGGGVGRR